MNKNFLDEVLIEGLKENPFLLESYMVSSCSPIEFILNENIDFINYHVDVEVVQEAYSSIEGEITRLNKMKHQINASIESGQDLYESLRLSEDKQEDINRILGFYNQALDQTQHAITLIRNELIGRIKNYKNLVAKVAATMDMNSKREYFEQLQNQVNVADSLFATLVEFIRNIVRSKQLIKNLVMIKEKYKDDNIVNIDSIANIRSDIQNIILTKNQIVPIYASEINDMKEGIKKMQKFGELENKLNQYHQNLTKKAQNAPSDDIEAVKQATFGSLAIFNKLSYIVGLGVMYDGMIDYTIKGFKGLAEIAGKIKSAIMGKDPSKIAKESRRVENVTNFNIITQTIQKVIDILSDKLPFAAKALNVIKTSIGTGQIPATVGILILIVGAIKIFFKLRKKRLELKKSLEETKNKVAYIKRKYSSDNVMLLKNLENQIAKLEREYQDTELQENKTSERLTETIQDIQNQTKKGGQTDYV